MDKRLPIYMLVSLVLVLGYSLLFGPNATAEGATPDGTTPAGAPTAQENAGASAEPLVEPDPIEQAEPMLDTVLLGAPGDLVRYQATFDSLGGTLRDLRVHGWYDAGKLSEEKQEDPGHWVPLLDAPVDGQGNQYGSLLLTAGVSARDLFPADPSTLHWEHEWIEEAGVLEGVRFSLTSPDGLTLSKTIRRSKTAFELDVHLQFVNRGEDTSTRKATFVMAPAIGVPQSSEDKWYQEPTARLGWHDGSDIEISNEEVVADAGPTNRTDTFPRGDGTAFVGVDNKYFAVLLRSADPSSQATMTSASWARVWDTEWMTENPESAGTGFRHVVALQNLDLGIPAAGAQTDYHFKLYAGPKDKKVMGAADERLTALTASDLGFFSSIGSVLLTVLRFFEGLVGNWGLAIILLTLCVRLALFPMNRRSQTAMARHATKMKRVQPRLNELKEKYANNPQKQRQEQAKIMQEEGAFPPLGGCLPMFLQIPVFFGLYSALRVAFDLRQARFLWVEDLSMPDALIRDVLPGITLPLVGSIEHLNVLPPLMVFLWILQQRLMPKPTDEQALKMQRMMMWMPVLFGVMLYNYAAGLSLYMITSSLFGIMEYTVIRRIWPIDDTEKPREPGKFMKRLMELQEQAQQLEKQKQAQRSQGKKNKKR